MVQLEYLLPTLKHTEEIEQKRIIAEAVLNARIDAQVTASTAWYPLGTVSVTDGNTKVTGSGTRFLTAGINPGAALRIDKRPYAWEIKSVVSDTELELAAPHYGGTVSDVSYSIDRNHQSTLPAILAVRLAKAMGNWEERYDTDMRTITGKSAYEVAVEDGYVGSKMFTNHMLRAAAIVKAVFG